MNVYDDSGLFGSTRAETTLYEPPIREPVDEASKMRCRLCHEWVLVGEEQTHVGLHLRVEEALDPLTSDAAFRRARCELLRLNPDIARADGWRRLGESLWKMEAEKMGLRIKREGSS